MRNNIAFDIDGVILNIFPEMKRILEKNYNIIIEENKNTTHSLENSYKEITPQMMINVVGKAIIANNPLCDGAFDLIYTLYKRTLDPIIFYTSRKIDAMYYTYGNLKKYFASVPFYIYFNSGNKGNVAGNFDYFVEDKRKNILNLADNGVKVIVPLRKYNEGIIHKNVEYIDTLQELVPRIYEGEFTI